MEEHKEGMGAHAHGPMCNCYHHWSWGWMLLRIIIVVILICGAFVAGVSAGLLKGRFVGMMGYEQGAFFARPVGHPNMMGGAWDRNDWQDGDRGGMMLTAVFGVVKSVAGNKIVITNNGGEDQAILSQATTTIVFGPQELPLSSIKAGQAIRAAGALDADKNMVARAIEVVSLAP